MHGMETHSEFSTLGWKIVLNVGKPALPCTIPAAISLHSLLEHLIRKKQIQPGSHLQDQKYARNMQVIF